MNWLIFAYNISCIAAVALTYTRQTSLFIPLCWRDGGKIQNKKAAEKCLTRFAHDGQFTSLNGIRTTICLPNLTPVTFAPFLTFPVRRRHVAHKLACNSLIKTVVARDLRGGGEDQERQERGNGGSRLSGCNKKNALKKSWPLYTEAENNERNWNFSLAAQWRAANFKVRTSLPSIIVGELQSRERA